MEMTAESSRTWDFDAFPYKQNFFAIIGTLCWILLPLAFVTPGQKNGFHAVSSGHVFLSNGVVFVIYIFS